jgi:GTP diphosphokinase / guanosine-3',5'-bis(diphosphate) 3'-diphosphatase
MRGALVAGEVLTTATADAEGAARIKETAETAASAQQAPQTPPETDETPATRPQRRTPARSARQDRQEARQESASPQPAPLPGVGVRRRLARLGAQRGSGMNPVLEPLMKTIRAHHPKADFRQVERAYDVAAHWHKDQKRKSGDPYITHPLAVATILAELGMNT